MTEPKVSWGYSHDGELYTLADDRDDAIASLGGGGYVAQLRQADCLPAWESTLDGRWLHELAEDAHAEADQASPDVDSFEQASDEQLDELQASLRGVLMTWLDSHRLRWSTSYYVVIGGTVEEVDGE